MEKHNYIARAAGQCGAQALGGSCDLPQSDPIHAVIQSRPSYDGGRAFFIAETVDRKDGQGTWERDLVEVTATPPRWDLWSDKAVGAQLGWSSYSEKGLEHADRFIAVLTEARQWLAEQPAAVRDDAYFAERERQHADAQVKWTALMAARAACRRCQQRVATVARHAEKRKAQGRKARHEADYCPAHAKVEQVA